MKRGTIWCTTTSLLGQELTDHNWPWQYLWSCIWTLAHRKSTKYFLTPKLCLIEFCSTGAREEPGTIPSSGISVIWTRQPNKFERVAKISSKFFSYELLYSICNTSAALLKALFESWAITGKAVAAAGWDAELKTAYSLLFCTPCTA
jgi:hypothetical protein